MLYQLLVSIVMLLMSVSLFLIQEIQQLAHPDVKSDNLHRVATILFYIAVISLLTIVLQLIII